MSARTLIALILVMIVAVGFARLTVKTLAQSIGGNSGIGVRIGGNAAGGATVNACAALGNQLDYSDATGCNLVQMMTGRP
jgi:hypothetical protein